MSWKYVDFAATMALAIAKSLGPGVLRSILLPAALLYLMVRIGSFITAEIVRLRLIRQFKLSVGESEQYDRSTMLYARILVAMILLAGLSYIIIEEWA